jgi:hypothetical protein
VVTTLYQEGTATFVKSGYGRTTVPLALISKERKSNLETKRTVIGMCTLTLRKRGARSGILGCGARGRKIDNRLG